MNLFEKNTELPPIPKELLEKAYRYYKKEGKPLEIKFTHNW